MLLRNLDGDPMSLETHCPHCKAEYQNIQHPLKPPGVIIQRQCKCVVTVTSVPGGTLTTIQAPPVLVLEANPSGTFAAAVAEYKRLKRVFGPWTKHEHSMSCDCGSYQYGSQYRGDWWYRPSIEGRDTEMCAFSEKERADADARAISQGRQLLDS